MLTKRSIKTGKFRCIRVVIELSVIGISAVTLKVRDMAASVRFYGLFPGVELLYGGGDAGFTSFRIGRNFLNLERSTDRCIRWGRVILYCDDVDMVHRSLAEKGLGSPEPRNASWGERFFHMDDPDGHEISFAQPIGKSIL